MVANINAVVVLVGVVHCGQGGYLVRRDRCFRHLTDIEDGHVHATPVRGVHCMRVRSTSLSRALGDSDAQQASPTSSLSDFRLWGDQYSGLPHAHKDKHTTWSNPPLSGYSTTSTPISRRDVDIFPRVRG